MPWTFVTWAPDSSRTGIPGIRGNSHGIAKEKNVRCLLSTRVKSLNIACFTCNSSCNARKCKKSEQVFSSSTGVSIRNNIQNIWVWVWVYKICIYIYKMYIYIYNIIYKYICVCVFTRSSYEWETERCSCKREKSSNKYANSRTWSLRTVAAKVIIHIARRVHSVATNMLYHSRTWNLRTVAAKVTIDVPWGVHSVATSRPFHVHQS